jgi:hypothetical protein
MRSAIASLLTVLALATACADDASNGDQDVVFEPGSRALRPGDALGEIERLPGGTAVPTDLRVIEAVECATDLLEVRTDREIIIANMPCDRIENRSFIDRFIGQPAAITVLQGGNLRLANDFAGSIELPATDPRVQEVDDTP